MWIQVILQFNLLQLHKSHNEIRFCNMHMHIGIQPCNFEDAVVLGYNTAQACSFFRAGFPGSLGSGFYVDLWSWNMCHGHQEINHDHAVTTWGIKRMLYLCDYSTDIMFNLTETLGQQPVPSNCSKIIEIHIHVYVFGTKCNNTRVINWFNTLL